MSYFPTGTVYGTLLNFQRACDVVAPHMHEPPYKAPPQAPVLYIKPANTWTANGGLIQVPAQADGTPSEVTIGATIAVVIGPQALIGSSFDATKHIAGYVLMNDLSLPQPNYFRPPVIYNCLDGFLGIGPEMVPAAELGDPATFTLDVRIEGELRQSIAFADLVRPVPQLLADVSEFMTLHAGDLLLLGTDVLRDGQRLTARVGQRIDIGAAGFPTSLSNALVAEVA